MVLDSNIERNRWFNQPRGFINCLEKTQLYQEYNAYCIDCKYAQKCKLIKTKKVLAK